MRPPKPLFGVKISKFYIAMNVSLKTSDPNMKFHNNPFGRFYVIREQLFAETTQTYIHTDRLEFCWGGVFVHNFA